MCSRLLAAALLLSPALAIAAPLPHWRTIETEHFRVHAYDEELAVAFRLAELAERAYQPLTRLLNWRPGGRIDIALADQSDSANGFAQVLPRNHIFDQAVTARFDVNQYLDLKVEGHFMEGAVSSNITNRGFYAADHPNGIAPTTRLLVIRLGFHM